MSRQSEKDEAATDEAMGYFNPQSMAIKRQPLGLILRSTLKKKKKKTQYGNVFVLALL